MGRSSDVLPAAPWTEWLQRQLPIFQGRYGDAAKPQMARWLGKSPKWVQQCLDGLDHASDARPTQSYQRRALEDALTGTSYSLSDVYPREVLAASEPTDEPGWCPDCGEMVATLRGRCCWCSTRVESCAQAA